MDKTFNAEPTKEFFITMLVRDINLKDAIGDLVDNCIDGANRLRGRDGDFKGLIIDITLDENSFTIKDNCGGIDLEIAKQYAFRFGRPDHVEDIKFSIGQFGIGMKRALFKMGKNFTIDSKTISNSFSMTVDVDEWSKQKDWFFPYNSANDYSSNPIDPNRTGTSITVNSLNNDVKSAFKDDQFLQSLQNDLELDQLYNINKGLKINFNTNSLKAKSLKFNVSEDFKIGNWENEYEGVKVKLLVGVGTQSQELGGWYIFCNDRLIVGPDTSELTGWTGKGKGGVANYHHQYYRFRGYAFFSAEDSEKLPWNTTKTGMNPDSPIFKAVRLQMIEMMKTVINGFLNPLKKENESTYDGERILNKKLDESQSINIADSTNLIKYYASDKSFTHPTPLPSNHKVTEGKTRINYEADKDLVERLKTVLKVKTNQEVGLKTFEYVVKNEL